MYTYAEDNPASLEDAVTNLEKIIGYFYPEEPAVTVERVELRSRLHKVKGIDDYNLGDYVEDYPSVTYNLSIREMMDGIPIYVDVGDRLSLDLASDKGKKGVNDFWRKNVKLWRVGDNYFEFMNKKRFELNTVWLKRINKIEEDVPLQNVDIIINNLEKEIERAKGKLSNQGFVSKAPAQLVAAEKEKLENNEKKAASLVSRNAELKESL